MLLCTTAFAIVSLLFVLTCLFWHCCAWLALILTGTIGGHSRWNTIPDKHKTSWDMMTQNETKICDTELRCPVLTCSWDEWIQLIRLPDKNEVKKTEVKMFYCISQYCLYCVQYWPWIKNVSIFSLSENLVLVVEFITVSIMWHNTILI